MKVAFIAGSSKHGKALLASAGSNCVTANHLSEKFHRLIDSEKPIATECLPRLVCVFVYVATLVVTHQIVGDVSFERYGQHVFDAGFEFFGRFHVHELGFGNERNATHRGTLSAAVGYDNSFSVDVQIVRMQDHGVGVLRTNHLKSNPADISDIGIRTIVE